MEACNLPNCQICVNSTKNCNSGDFPSNRLSCLKCEGQSCHNAAQIPSQMCLNHRVGDQCVTVFNGCKSWKKSFNTLNFKCPISDNISRRGCLADIPSPDSFKCIWNSLECIRCAGINCNRQNIRVDDNCVICNSKDDPTCATSPEQWMPRQCSAPGNGRCYSLVDGKSLNTRS